MTKTIFALTILLSTTQSFAAPSQGVAQTRRPASTDVAVVIVSLDALENAFNITAKDGTVYHLENAARFTLSKMNALSNSLDNGVSVKLRVEGKEIVDIVIN